MNTAITATALAAALLAGGTATVIGLQKDVQISLDGQVQSSSGLALTVADVLAARGVTLNASDEVTPALDSPVASGSTISVRFGKQLTLNVDGSSRTFLTRAATLDEALTTDAMIAGTIPLATVRPVSLVGARTSIPRNSALPREGATVHVTTPKHVKLKVAGKATDLVTTAPTVAVLLSEQNLTVGAKDQLSAPGSSRVIENQQIVLDRVVTKTKTKTEKVPHQTTKKKNSRLWKGETKVLKAGRDGKAKRVYEVTLVNGKHAKKTVLSETVLTKPTTEVVEVGTKTSSSGVGLNLARAAMWDRIAKCESGGRWNINTGNGYYGGLQFNKQSWNSNGGRDFAPRADLASRAEQITVANRYYAKAGTRPWSCA